eukprot:gene11619-11763_t
MDSAEALSAGGSVGWPAVDEAMGGSAAQPLPDNGSVGSATTTGAASSKRAAAMFDSASSTVEGSSEKLLSDILFIGSEAAAAAAAAAMADGTEDKMARSTSPSGPPSPAAAAAENMSSALGGFGLPDVFPALRSLIGAEEAATAFLAATAAAASTTTSVSARGVAKGVVLQYEAATQSIPCSIKLHDAPHSSLLDLGGLLKGSLQQHLATAMAAVAATAYDGTAACHSYVQSAVFPGCVQLLASVFSIKPQLPAGWSAAGAHRTDSGKFKDDSSRISFVDGHSGSSGMLAAQLLTAVCGRLQQAMARARSQQEVADVGLQAASEGGIDVYVDGSMASQQGVAATAIDEAEQRPGKEQQQLGLTVRALGNSSSAHCRLLLLQGGDVVFEVPDVVMQQATHGTFSTSVRLPPLPVGVVQLALLGRTSTEAEGTRPGSSGGPPPAAVPLLLQPLLVLPEDAATELEALFQSSAAEAAVAALSAGQDSNTAIAEAAAGAWAVLSSLTVDLAYVLSAAQQLSSSKEATVEGSSGGDGGSEGVLPGDVRSVLTHLLTHLAGWHCWNMLNFTVQHLASLAAAGGAQAAPMAAEHFPPAASNAAAAAAATVGPGSHPAEGLPIAELLPAKGAAASKTTAEGWEEPAVLKQLSDDLEGETTLADALFNMTTGHSCDEHSGVEPDVSEPLCSSASSRGAAACSEVSTSPSYTPCAATAPTASAAPDVVAQADDACWRECGSSGDGGGGGGAPEVSCDASDVTTMQAAIAPLSQLLVVM